MNDGYAMRFISIPSEILNRKIRAFNRLERFKHIHACRDAVQKLGATHWAILLPHKGFKNADGAWIFKGDRYVQVEIKYWPYAEWHEIALEGLTIAPEHFNLSDVISTKNDASRI